MKFSLEAGETEVLDYLKRQNRPYSALDIVSNLHNSISKANMTKVLESLCLKQLVSSKALGKSIIYCALQTEVVEDIDETIIESLDEELNLKQLETKRLAAELSALTKLPTDTELEKEVEEAQLELDTLTQNMTDQVEELDSSKLLDARNEICSLEKALKRRTKLAQDLYKTVKYDLADQLELDKNELDEQLGLYWP